MAKGLWTVLNVDNVDKSLEWYKALGLKAKPGAIEGMEWGEVHSGESGMILWNKNVIVPGQAEDTRAWLSGELGKGVIVSIGVADARKAWTRAQENGLVVEVPLREQPWGGRDFTVIDPDGYVVNIVDRFPGDTPAKKTAKRTAKKAKKAVKRVATKAKTATGKRKRR